MIILGTQSPRRREIFNFFSLPHQTISPKFDEDSIPFEGEPGDYVCALAKGKARSLLPEFSESTIITADSIVYKEGRVYGKPNDEQHAFEMLHDLSDNWHTVFTGLTLFHQNSYYSKAEATEVQFNPLTAEQIRTYHQLVNWQDKAGAYGIQLAGGMIVRQIKGCYYNVMGFPINTLRELLNTIGIDLWHYLK